MFNKFIDSIKNQEPKDVSFFGYNRSVLKLMAKNAVKSANPKDYVDTILAILKWGGLDVGVLSRHYKRASEVLPLKIQDIIEALSLTDIGERFDAFLHGNAKIKGVGVSYFTKIIFFFDPDNTIILDKWIPCSIFTALDKCSELSGQKPSIYGYKYYFKKNVLNFYRKTSSSDYLQAIHDIKLLREKLLSIFPDISVETVEMALFSQGKGRGIWRNEVVKYMENLLKKQ